MFGIVVNFLILFFVKIPPNQGFNKLYADKILTFYL